MTEVVAVQGPLELGTAVDVATRTAPIGFARPPQPRGLLLDDQPAYELSWPCGTCALLFRRLGGANHTVGIDEVRQRLLLPTDRIDPVVVEAFSQVLPVETYLVLLLEVRPRLVTPMGPGDYFAGEQVDTWSLQGFTGLPQHPGVAYYRAGEQELPFDAESYRVDERLFEFIVPMVPTTWNDPATVASYERELAGGACPTAVALSIVDIAEGSASVHEQHWGLMHFLLDGHHKMQAAAHTGRPVRLLSFLAINEGTAAPESALRTPDILDLAHGSLP